MKINRRLEEFTDNGEQNSSAMVTTRGNKSWKPRCYSCGQLGYFRSESPKSKALVSHRTRLRLLRRLQKIIITLVPDVSDSVGAFAASVG